MFSSLNIHFKWFETKCSTKMDFRFRHNTFMEKSALKMIGCLSTKKKLDTKHHFNLREKKDETIVAFNQLIDISIEKKKEY